jgi:hypothetical protein
LIWKDMIVTRWIHDKSEHVIIKFPPRNFSNIKLPFLFLFFILVLQHVVRHFMCSFISFIALFVSPQRQARSSSFFLAACLNWGPENKRSIVIPRYHDSLNFFPGSFTELFSLLFYCILAKENIADCILMACFSKVKK